MGELKKAKEYHNLHLKITEEVGDKRWASKTYGNFGNVPHCLGDFKKP